MKRFDPRSVTKRKMKGLAIETDFKKTRLTPSEGKIKRHSPASLTGEVSSHLCRHILPARWLGVGKLNDGKQELALLRNIPDGRHVQLLCLRCES